MKLHCNVIRDLMPLYKDEVCREESKALVEKHLRECEICKKELQLMQNDISAQEIQEQRENAIDNLEAKVKKKNRRKFRIAMAVVLTAVLVSIFYWKYDSQIIKARDVTQVHAITVMPTVIITVEEYALAGKLLQSEDIQAAIESNKLAVTLDESVQAEFFDQIHVNAESVDSVTISVINDHVYFGYTVDDFKYILAFSSADYITKTAAQYKANLKVKYLLDNYNNMTYTEAYSVRDWFLQHYR